MRRTGVIAALASLALLLCTVSAASSSSPVSDDGCVCITLYDPVCEPFSNTTYSNACVAGCANVTTTVPGECGTTNNAGLDTSPGIDPGCICPTVWMPVCDTLSGTTYSNTCTASCSNMTKEQLVPGECSPSAAKCAQRCPQAFGHHSYDPVCIITRKVPNTRATRTTTYFNPCIGACYAPATRVLGSYKGVCNATADRLCANATKAGVQVCSVAAAAEFPTVCYAQRLAAPKQNASTYSGQCQQRQAAQMAGRCPPTNPVYLEPVVDCFADPCSVAPQCNKTNVTCVGRYCPGFLRTTYLTGLCQAVWIDHAGNIDEGCTFGGSRTSPAAVKALPCCPPVARSHDPPCRDCGLRGRK